MVEFLDGMKDAGWKISIILRYRKKIRIRKTANWKYFLCLCTLLIFMSMDFTGNEAWINEIVRFY